MSSFFYSSNVEISKQICVQNVYVTEKRLDETDFCYSWIDILAKNIFVNK